MQPRISDSLKRNHLHLNSKPQSRSPSKSPLKSYLTTSRSLEKQRLQGISISRHKKITFDRLYDEQILPNKKNQGSTRQPSQGSRVTPTSISSKKNISFLQGSEYIQSNQKHTQLHAIIPQRPKQNNQQIVHLYYQTSSRSPNIRPSNMQLNMIRSPPKKYDLRGIIKY